MTNSHDEPPPIVLDGDEDEYDSNDSKYSDTCADDHEDIYNSENDDEVI
jgi:hypothetical protein